MGHPDFILLVRALRDLADGEGVVVPMAVERGGLGIRDEDPVDAEAGLEALEIGELEVGPTGFGQSLLFPSGAELGRFGDDRGVFYGVSEGAALGESAEAVEIFSGPIHVFWVECEESVARCVVTHPNE